MSLAESMGLESLGAFAGRRRVYDADIVKWVLKRRGEKLSVQTISAMGQLPIPDVQKMLEQFGGEPSEPQPPKRPQPTIPPEPVHREPGFVHLFIQRLGVSDLESVARRPTLHSILNEVARRHGLSSDVLRGPRQDHPALFARHEAIWRMYRAGLWSRVHIGKFMGGRDHSTVSNAIRRHEERRAESARIITGETA
jgi:hypothetical protein